MVSTPHHLAVLPYAVSALVPAISARTVEHHHGKHQQGYIDALNKLVAGTEYAEMSLRETIASCAGQAAKEKIFNNAAQAWSHTFYWQSMKPRGGGEPPASLKPLLEASFGSVDACKAALARASTERFGSGWVWLMRNGATLSVVSTANADVPDRNALLVIDVWEHAYYLGARRA